MTFLYNLCIHFLSISLLISFLSEARSVAISTLMKEQTNQGSFEQPPKQFKVRVLLDEQKGSSQWSLYTQKGIVISDAINYRKKRISKQATTILCMKNGCLYINGKKLEEKNIKIEPIEGYLGFSNKAYQGSFICIIQNNRCMLINQLELEDYVYSVLRSESWPGWPLEVNKVFAIASRTYVIAKVLEGGNKNPYHIKNTNIHQTYNGFHESDILKKAVEQTKGLIVTYNKKPIHAMFDSCCGGIIPAHLSGVDFKKAPYLARTKICDFCKPCKIYRWKCELDCTEFEKLLQKKGFPIYSIQTIQALQDKAGAVQEVVIDWAQGITKLTGKQFYSLTAKIKSFCYSVQKKVKKIVIEGKGYGHHLGLCQWGVREMINFGYNYKSVLDFAYPGTTCMKLTLK